MRGGMGVIPFLLYVNGHVRGSVEEDVIEYIIILVNIKTIEKPKRLTMGAEKRGGALME